MNKKYGITIIILAAVLILLQYLSARGALSAPVDEIKVIGIGLGLDKTRQAGNFNTIAGFEVRELGFNHLSEALNRLPGVNIQHGSGQEHLTAIRSPVLTGGAGAGSFLFLEDGVPLRAAGFGNVNGLLEAIGELAGAIEIGRGPGSALYGSNAVHGSVNVLSNKPSKRRKSSLQARFGVNPFLGKFIASSSNALNRTTDARLGFSYLKDSGWRHSTGVEQFKGQLRLDSRWAGVRSKTLLSFHHLEQETGGYLVERKPDGKMGTGDENNPFSYKNRAVTFLNDNPDAYRNAQGVRGQNNLLWNINDSQQLNVTSWFRWTKINFLQHFLPTMPTEKNAHYSLGLRPIWQVQRAGNGGAVNFNFGGEAEYTHGTLSEIQAEEGKVLGPPMPPMKKTLYFKGTHYDYSIDATTFALFTQNDWQLPDERTTLTFGVRGEWVRYDYNNNTDDTSVLSCRKPMDHITVATSMMVEDANKIDKDKSFFCPPNQVNDFFTITPKVGINYQLTKNAPHQTFVFANYTRGQRAPQTTDLYRLRYRDRDAKFKPEKLESVELGFRGKQGAFRWQLVGYFMDKRRHHFRSSAFDPVVNGKTRHAGVEMDFFAPLLWDLSLRGAFSYARHWYNFNNESFKIRRGNYIDTAPRFLAHVELAYTHAYGRLALEYIRVDKYYTDPENAHSYAGHNLFNLRVNARVSADFHVFFHVLNVADTRHADRADYTGFNGARYFPGQPRAFYLGIKADF